MRVMANRRMIADRHHIIPRRKTQERRCLLLLIRPAMSPLASGLGLGTLRAHPCCPRQHRVYGVGCLSRLDTRRQER